MRHYGIVWTRVLAGLLLAVIPAAVAFIYVHPPTPTSFYPQCLFHATTGLYCPGCGGTRSVFHLLQGDIAQAVRSNLLVVTLVPLAAYYWLAGLQYVVSGRCGVPVIGRKHGAAMLVAVAVFTLVRNLPGFTGLSPEPLTLGQPK